MFPALWDMVQFLGGLWQADVDQLILIGIIVNTVMGAGLSHTSAWNSANHRASFATSPGVRLAMSCSIFSSLVMRGE
jgi:hypothetical protein